MFIKQLFILKDSEQEIPQWFQDEVDKKKPSDSFFKGNGYPGGRGGNRGGYRGGRGRGGGSYSSSNSCFSRPQSSGFKKDSAQDNYGYE